MHRETETEKCGAKGLASVSEVNSDIANPLNTNGKWPAERPSRGSHSEGGGEGGSFPHYHQTLGFLPDLRHSGECPCTPPLYPSADVSSDRYRRDPDHHTRVYAISQSSTA
jgi:hypothetical protein